MDALPPTPPAYEQSIKLKLVECGLSAAGVTVSYEHYLQSYEIRIEPEAGASSNHFACIQAASQHEIVTFADAELHKSYLAYASEQFRPMIIEQAKQELSKRGRLEGFPSRASFNSDRLFVEALEMHCGLAKGTAIRRYDTAWVFQPPIEGTSDFDTFSEKYGCLLSAIQLVSARGELDIGLIGNAAFATPK